MTPAEINDMSKVIHTLNRKWWPEDINERNKQEILILICSEITECMEGERKNIMDDKLPHRKMAEVEMADTAIRVMDVMGAFGYSYVEDHPEDIWATFHPDDIIDKNKASMLFSIIGVTTYGATYKTSQTFFSNMLYLVITYCRVFGYDLWGAVIEKLEYNKTRYDHSDEGRAAEGGKKW